MSGTISPNAITGPYDFQLDTLYFIASNGQQIDLRYIYSELNIYQDLFANVMHGDLTVSDSTNIFGYIVSQGFEFIQISLDKPGLNKPIQKTFRVTSRAPTSPVKLSNQTVTIHFASEELLLSKATKISKSYNGKLISDIAKDIVTHVLKVPSNEFPSQNIETTNNICTVTIPNYTPFQALNMLCKRATSSYVGATYLFYENQTGYNFRSLQSLMDVQQPVAIYNYSVKNIDDNNPNLDFYDIAKYQFVKFPNSLDSLIHGQSASQLYTLDVLRQKYTILDLNGDDLRNSSVSLGNAPSYNNLQDRLGNTPATSYASNRKFFPTNLDQDKQQYTQGKQQINQSNVEKWLLERQALIRQLLSIRIKMVVPGNNQLKIGDIIQLNLPSIEMQQDDTGNPQRKLDPYFSGNWIITAIRHRVAIQFFESTVEICKDALQQNVPSSTLGSYA